MSKRTPAETADVLLALTTFAAPALTGELAAALGRRGAAPRIHCVQGIDAVEQALDELPAEAASPGLAWCWPRLEDLWRDLPTPMSEPADDYRDAAVDLAEEVLDLARRSGCPLLFVLPAVPAERPLGLADADTTGGMVAIATAAREAIRARLAGLRDVHLIDAEEDVRLLGAARCGMEPDGYSAEFRARIADRSARMMELLGQPRIRALVIEADGVLWQGQLAVRGPAGIDPRSARAVQRRLLDLRRAGVLLGLVADADGALLDTALRRPDLLVRRHHLTAVRAGSLTAELLAEMAAALEAQPHEIAVLRAVPDGPQGWAVHLVSAGKTPLPDRLPTDAEDRRRGARGAPGQVPGVPWSAYDPLAEMNIRVRFRAIDARAAATAQALLSPGHSFELNRWQSTPARFAVLAREPDHLVRLVELTDADGDHGVVGLYVARLRGEEAELLAFRLANLAAGRAVERAMVADLLASCADMGATRVMACAERVAGNEWGTRFFAGLGIGSSSAPLPPCAWPAHVRKEQPDD